ncbi:head GIN domain-containing protein [Flavobacterium sp. 25HG05S-40]|uniref:head GIN domain-containing protein n=1 Tax=Flavobacterium sp. 25HG05S-40 TaxID=3458682 RepID=UPI004044D42D
MSKVITTTAAVLMSFIAFSQVSENRTVGQFSKLKASNGIQVFYTVSNTTNLRVETDNNEKIQFIKTEVEGETLNVYVDTGSEHYKSSKNRKGRNINGVNFQILKVFITGEALRGIKASSSADIKIENLNAADEIALAVSSSGSISGKFDGDDIAIDASSSGDFEGTINAKNIEVETSSSADVDLNGKTIKLTIKASSSSSCDADKLLAEDVTATASSSADIEVYASKSIDAKASSSADINYYGNPAQVVADKSSSGSVTKK